MNLDQRIDNEEMEAVKSMEPFVRERLDTYLIGDRRKWWPTDFCEFMQENDEKCVKELLELRREARELTDEEIVVLVGSEVTEKALPNYSARLANLFPDSSGVSQNAWNIWNREWTAEESLHGDALNNYLVLTGIVDPIA